MKPIFFNTNEVLAILEDRKQCARKIIKYDRNSVYKSACTSGKWNEMYKEIPDDILMWYAKDGVIAPYEVGDILYVKEKWQGWVGRYVYKVAANGPKWKTLLCSKIKWKSSICMPKEAARIYLKINNIRTERLHEITEMQVIKEGFTDNFDMEDNTLYPCGYYFKQAWDKKINKKDIDKYSWEANPWVWVIEFEKTDMEGK